MRAAPPAAAFAAVLAMVSGCTANPEAPTVAEKPELIWSGHPVEIDGQAVGPTGVNLSLYKDPNQRSSGEFRYEITNGCTAGGTVMNDDEVLAYEVLRPCSAEDIVWIGRLNIIAPSGLPAPEPARLTWTQETAVLKSIRGEARFRRDEP